MALFLALQAVGPPFFGHLDPACGPGLLWGVDTPTQEIARASADVHCQSACQSPAADAD